MLPITHPERPESYTPTVICGWIEGIVTRVDDPEKLGRVKVIAPSIDPNNELPNGDDGWIHVQTNFTLNAMQGGSYHPLMVGTVVRLDARHPGDGKNWIISGCIPNRVDRPSPDTDRAAGTYGTVTENGVVDINDDARQSRLFSTPHGHIEHWSETGDRLIQTEQGKFFASRNGEMLIANSVAHTQISSDGTVEQRSAAGASTVLDKDGTVQIDSAFSRGLRLDEKMHSLEGPLSSLAAALKTVGGKLQGYLGQAKEVLNSVEQIADALGEDLPTEELESFIVELDEQVADFGAKLEEIVQKGAAALEMIEKVSTADFSEMLSPQMKRLSRIDPVASVVERVLESSQDPDSIIQMLRQQLPSDLLDSADLPTLKRLISRLRFDRGLQIESILDELMGDDLDLIRPLLRGGLMRTVTQIQQVLARPLPSDATPQVIAQELQQRSRAILNALPENLRDRIQESEVFKIVQQTNPSVENVLTRLAQASAGAARRDIQQNLSPALDSIQPVRQILGALRNGGSADEAFNVLRQNPAFSSLPNPATSSTQEVLRGLAAGFRDQSTNDVLGRSMAAAADAANLSPPSNSMMALKIGSEMAELSSIAASVRVLPTLAEMGTATSVLFAGTTGAGIKTPFGKLSLGALGGGLFSPGVFSLLSKAGGILMSEDQSVTIASLQGVSPGSEDGDPPRWNSENARIVVNEAGIRLESLSGRKVQHCLEIRPDGIFVNGILLAIAPQSPNEPGS